MADVDEARKTRPAFYAVFVLALVASAVLWWVNRPQVPEFAEVTGVITLDGRPLDRVEVKFLPDPSEGTRGPISSCFTDAAGRYTIRCDRYERDGAVPGKHRIVFFDSTVFDTAATDPAPADPKRDQDRKPKQSRIPERYEHLSTTPFVDVEVKAGTNEVNFELASKK